MKRPYSGESWTRFKELMQKLSKRTAIVETRAQNNEDNISELQPIVEELQETVGDINDYTTGINLVRGSRNFTLGTQISPYNSNVNIDGFKTNDVGSFSVETDVNGNKYAKLGRTEANNTLFTNPVLGVKAGEEYTYCCEIMAEDVTKLTTVGKVGVIQVFNGNTWLAESPNPVTSDLLASMKNGKWIKLVSYITIPQNISSENGMICVAHTQIMNQPICIRNCCLFKEKVNKPLYSIAPIDVAVEPINDFTTGINLLRGTRNFKTFTKTLFTGLTIDGFTFTGNIKVEKEADFYYAQASTTNTTENRYFNCSYIEVIPNKTYTFFGEVKLDSQNISEDSRLLTAILYNESGTYLSEVNLKLQQLKLNPLDNTGWQSFVWKFTPSNSSAKYVVFRCGIQGSIATVSYRYLGAVNGSINHPIYAPNPNDVEFINDYTTGINLIKGSRDFTQGKNIVVGTLTSDGFSYNQTYTKFDKDQDGFTVATTSRSGATDTDYIDISSNLVKASSGETCTISVEYSFNDASQLTNSKFINAIIFQGVTDTGASVEYFNCLSGKSYTDVKSGEWYKLVFTKELSTETVKMVRVILRLQGNGSVSFRKLCLYKNEINNPIYSVSPMDMALEPVNDITTGINLLRGTRDFAKGLTKYGTSAYFTDGVFYPENNIALSHDHDGFGVLTNTATSGTNFISYVYDGEIKAGDEYTFSFMVKRASGTVPNGNVLATIYEMDSTGATVNGIKDITFSDAGLIKESMEVGTWYKAVYSFTIPSSWKSTSILRVCMVYQNVTVSNQLSFKMPNLNVGRIENPEWSQSPFDVAMASDISLGGSTGGVSLPLSIQNGGTGSGTIAGAKSNLGISDLETKVNGINDITTEINLLRGTRTFRLGSTRPVGNSMPFNDGFYSNFPARLSFNRDENDVMIATINSMEETNINQYTRLMSSVFVSESKDDVFTCSFDMLVENDNHVVSNSFPLRTLTAFEYDINTGDQIAYEDYTVNNSPGISSSYVKGKWYHIVIHYKRKSTNDKVYIAFSGLARGAGITKYKNFTANVGTITNPSYLPNPNDVDYINDITTGINLLRGTRDFVDGKTRGSKITTWNWIDGFNPVSGRSFYKDSLGFTVCKITQTGVSSTTPKDLQTSIIEDISTGDTLTFYLEFMFEELETPLTSSTVFGGIRGITSGIVPVNNFALTLSSLGITNFELGKWYSGHVTTTINDASAVAANAYIRLTGNGSLHIRKLCVYKGNIVHPEWSDNPFDVASIFGAPMMLGTPTRIPDGTNLDDIREAGSYFNPSGAKVTNSPATSSFRLDILDENGQRGWLRQFFTTPLGHVYTRETTSSEIGASWGSWSELYTYTSVRPIEGGGTNANTLAGAKSNLGITSLEQKVKFVNVPQAFVSGEDLDSYTYPAERFSAATSITTSLQHAPSSPGNHGYFISIPYGSPLGSNDTAPSNAVIQFWINVADLRVFMRKCANDKQFTSWAEFSKGSSGGGSNLHVTRLVALVDLTVGRTEHSSISLSSFKHDYGDQLPTSSVKLTGAPIVRAVNDLNYDIPHTPYSDNAEFFQYSIASLDSYWYTGSELARLDYSARITTGTGIKVYINVFWCD